jgi:hypothetical protein
MRTRTESRKEKTAVTHPPRRASWFLLIEKTPMEPETLLFEHYGSRLFGLDYRLLGTPADTEDVLHDAWLRLHAQDIAALDDPTLSVRCRNWRGTRLSTPVRALDGKSAKPRRTIARFRARGSPLLEIPAMPNQKITEIKRIFTSRLDALEHVLRIGERHFADANDFMDKRLVEDMFPFSSQIVIACNQPRGFSQWCQGRAVENLAREEVQSAGQAHAVIAQTRDLVAGIDADDSKLDEIKRIGLGPGRYCELPGQLYVDDYLLPNLYFHITMAYAILRQLGAPVGKSDYMSFLEPAVRHEGAAR